MGPFNMRVTKANIIFILLDMCSDSNRRLCNIWAQEGLCEKSPSYMLGNCMKSCGVCEGMYLAYICTNVVVDINKQ